MHKKSLRVYADELLRDRLIEESMGNDFELNVERALIESFQKLDKDILAEALPATGKPDKELMDVAMSGRFIIYLFYCDYNCPSNKIQSIFVVTFIKFLSNF